jgi:hypothetical protein
MPDYPVKPLDLSGLTTYPLKSRKSKVGADELARLPKPGGSFSDFWESLPRVLAVRELQDLVSRIKKARREGRALLWGLGAHVIKVGLSPLIIHLMEEGYVSGLALNGAGIIHDFELALVGQTSEEVEEGLESGEFGMAEETGELLNRAVQEGVEREMGIGEAVGAFHDQHKPQFMRNSLLWNGYRLSIPVTVHVAVGTDIVHMHPQASGEAIGKGSHQDFRLFSAMVAKLHGGGVYLNLGSAVILPEVFLKAVSVVRNLGHPLTDFSTANFDFIRHYRPRKNVVERPVSGSGRGFELVGHHEILVPLLATALVEPTS